MNRENNSNPGALNAIVGALNPSDPGSNLGTEVNDLLDGVKSSDVGVPNLLVDVHDPKKEAADQKKEVRNLEREVGNPIYLVDDDILGPSSRFSAGVHHGAAVIQAEAPSYFLNQTRRSIRRADGPELHAVDQAVVRENVSHDNQLIARPHAFRFHEERDRLLNRIVRIRFERQQKTFD